MTNYWVVRLAHRYPRIERLVEGRPALLLLDGQIKTENLDKELISEAEFRTVLRRQRFEDLAEVKAAILETSGSLTVERETDLPTPVEAELLRRLEHIEQQLQRLSHPLT